MLTLQHFSQRRKGRESGYAMAALLVGLAVMGILMSAALPVWRQSVRREREADLAFRGEQYARAIGLFQRKYAASFPPNLDVLVEQKFLRKKYKDPITNDEFQLLFQATATQKPGTVGTPQDGNPLGRPGAPAFPGQDADDDAPANPFGGTSGTLGPKGGIIGVASKSKDRSIRLYNGRSRYNEWQFVYSPPAQQPGAERPGEVPSQGGKGPAGAKAPGIGGFGGAGGFVGKGRPPQFPDKSKGGLGPGAPKGRNVPFSER